MKYMRKTAGYPWTDHKPNTQIAKQLNEPQILSENKNAEVTVYNIQTECSYKYRE